MIIRKATILDLPPILELQKTVYLEEAILYNDYTIQPLHQTLESLSEEFLSSEILLLEIDSEIGGSVRAMADNKTCHIGKLMVSEKHRNLGFGKLLMKEIEQLFPDCVRFELFTGHKSIRNLTLYSNLGYKSFKNKMVHPGLELVFMEKLAENSPSRQFQAE